MPVTHDEITFEQVANTETVRTPIQALNIVDRQLPPKKNRFHEAVQSFFVRGACQNVEF